MDGVAVRPRVFSSKCLGFAACRWNGVTMPDKFIESLKPHVEFITACPEADMGLGVPRDPIRVVLAKGGYSLMQFNTKRDVTDLMKGYTENFLESMEEVDGFILKDRSPSCGIKSVKVYPGLEKSNVVETTSGFFAKGVLDKFAGVVGADAQGEPGCFNSAEPVADIHTVVKMGMAVRPRTDDPRCR